MQKNKEKDGTYRLLSSFIYLPNVYIASEFVMSIVPILCGWAVLCGFVFSKLFVFGCL